MELKRLWPAHGLNGLHDGPAWTPCGGTVLRIVCAMKSLLFAIALLVLATPACAAPSYVSTFHSIGLYWAPPGGAPGNSARVEFRAAGTSAWRQGLALWFDARNAQYRGSIVELKPGTAYMVRLRLDSGLTETIEATTWSEEFRIQRTIQVKPGTTHLVINASDSGNEREGYVVFTAPPGHNAIDQGAVAGDDPRDSCVVVKQGTHHVIVRGLVLLGALAQGRG